MKKGWWRCSVFAATVAPVAGPETTRDSWVSCLSLTFISGPVCANSDPSGNAWNKSLDQYSSLGLTACLIKF
ncbi:hypothetical protein BD779DRAFT_1565483 [Infundibulicybe gibba]|nr:hypothetical protein BD779DRAFT_1565483 [Infundibulicybe gibba]